MTHACARILYMLSTPELFHERQRIVDLYMKIEGCARDEFDGQG